MTTDPMLGPRLLADPVVHEDPWPHFTCAQVFEPADVQHVEDLYARAVGWKRHETPLYNCVMRDVTADLDPGLKRAALARMRALTGQRLTDELQVTAQRMVPGDVIGRHSDRPLLGYESVRLVVQLNRDWRPAYGGVFEMYRDPAAALAPRVIAPAHNHGFGFVLSETSHHAVTKVTRERSSMVLSFWHVGSTPELRAHIEELYGRVSLGALPAALHPVMSAAEAELPEEQSFAAGKVACVLHAWGYGVGVVERGYRAACAPVPLPEPRLDQPASLVAEDDMAIALARWAVHLQLEAFELTHWRALERALGHRGAPAPTRFFCSVAFPVPSQAI